MIERQLAFDLPFRPALGRADFLVAPCNEAAVAWLDRWPRWPTQLLAVVGPAGSGKSHLGEVWRQASGAARMSASDFDVRRAEMPGPGESVLLDDAEQATGRPDRESGLLHLVNYVREGGGSLLLLARSAPARWPIGLPDLASRLVAAPLASIGAPDDMLLQALLAKLFHDRQIQVGPDVIIFLLKRMERSFEAAHALAGALDQAALAGKRRITVPLARQILARM